MLTGAPPMAGGPSGSFLCRQSHAPGLRADTVMATDPARYIEATIRADGRLRALSINPHAMYDLTAAQLADACLEAGCAGAVGRCAPRPVVAIARLTRR